MEAAIILFILVFSFISWHLDNKPKRKQSTKNQPPRHTTNVGIFKRKYTTPITVPDNLPPEPKFGNPFISPEDKLAHLQSPYWKQLKLDRLALANNSCELCQSHTLLQLHHITYDRLGCESISDVRILCNECHQLQHNHYGYNRLTNYYPLIKPKLAE